jgi:hypothetical protein
LRKDVAWDWTDVQENTFQDLKTAFTTRPILVYPDVTKLLQVEADASGRAKSNPEHVMQ